MKPSFLKISILLFLIPVFSFADLPGGGPRWTTAFVITNTKSFPDYSFYYTYQGDSNSIKQGKTYSFKHAGSPTVDWEIYVYAKNNQSGKITERLSAGSNEEKSTITIKEIKNDSIIADVSTSSYSGEADVATTPSNDNDGNNDQPNDKVIPIQGISSTTFLLLGICGFAALILAFILFKRMKKA